MKSCHTHFTFSGFVTNLVVIYINIWPQLWWHKHCVPSPKVKSWRDNFKLSGFATSLFLGLLPSLWDSVSDLAFAEEEETAKNLGVNPLNGLSASTYLTYFFISIPFHATALAGLQRLLRLPAAKSHNRRCQGIFCRGTAGCFKLFFEQKLSEILGRAI